MEPSQSQPRPQRQPETSAAPSGIVILDFGGQYTQLIARRVREQDVFSEILPFRASWAEIAARRPAGIILSGGPSSVYDADAPRCAPEVFAGHVPVLGICYGLQLMVLSNNLGDAKSIVTHPATTTHHRVSDDDKARLGISPGLIRLSVGLEAVEDLRADIARGLAAV